MQKRKDLKQRMITGKNVKLTQAEKDDKRDDTDILRDMEEREIYGGYEVIFPLDEIRANEPRIEMYRSYLEAAQDHYDTFLNG